MPGGFQYGVPYPAPQQVQERPRCWAQGYDSVARECRQCGFQTSCKDECDRMKMRSYAHYAVPQPVPVPVPVQYGPPQQPMPPQPLAQVQNLHSTMARAVVPAMQAQQMRSTVPTGYGWFQDPLYFQMAAIPPPVRVQLQGESFFERIAKNAVLAAGEAMLGQCFLAMRQAIWAPQPEQVVDVQPVQPQGPQNR